MCYVKIILNTPICSITCMYTNVLHDTNHVGVLQYLVGPSEAHRVGRLSQAFSYRANNISAKK